MSRLTNSILVVSLGINIILGGLFWHRYLYERSMTWSLAGNAHAIKAVSDAYFLEHPETEYVKYTDLVKWDKTEWLKKNELPGRMYQPVLAKGDDQVIILFEGWYGIIGLRH